MQTVAFCMRDAGDSRHWRLDDESAASGGSPQNVPTCKARLTAEQVSRSTPWSAPVWPRDWQVMNNKSIELTGGAGLVFDAAPIGHNQNNNKVAGSFVK